jgi:diguanylate cyclase (GGDEF)-like protein
MDRDGQDRKFRLWREGVSFALPLALSCCLIVVLDLTGGFAWLALSHDGLPLDEIFFLGLISCMGYLFVLLRRTHRLDRELSRRRRAHSDMRRQLQCDSLTGLPNRRALAATIDAMATPLGPTRPISILVIDIDRFRPVNDIHGHEGGDQALLEIGERIAAIAGPIGTVARLSGDEFACVLRESAGADVASRAARAILDEIARPIELRSGTIEVTASIGIVSAPPRDWSADRCLRAAAFAAERSSELGPGGFSFFAPEMDAAMTRRAGLEIELRGAIARGEILPHFQPIVDLATGQLCGFECLARWHHPERGMIAPDEFIPIAEEAGMIPQLGRAILRSACEAAREWPPYLTLSVNVSPLQLSDSWLPQNIMATLAETGFSPRRLVVEITESRLVSDYESARTVLTSLSNAGVQIALDDFGTGYASLKHLRELKFNRLKIDRSFVERLDDPETLAIVRSIIRMCRGLRLSVTAEGIETQEQLSVLRQLSCPLGQGYHFGRPVESDAALAIAWQGASRPSPEIAPLIAAAKASPRSRSR